MALPTYFALDTHQVDLYAGQRYRDVLMHTPAHWSNAIVFANDLSQSQSQPGSSLPLTVPPAAMYVYGNAVGFACKPAAGSAVDVAGPLIARCPVTFPQTGSSSSSNGLLLTADRMTFDEAGLSTVAIHRSGVVRLRGDAGLVLADSGVYDTHDCASLIGVDVAAVDAAVAGEDTAWLRMDTTGPSGAAVEDTLVVGARFVLADTADKAYRLFVVLATDVAAGQLLVNVQGDAYARMQLRGVHTIHVLPDVGVRPRAPATIGPLPDVALVQAPTALLPLTTVQFGDTLTHSRCAELGALEELVARDAPDSPLHPLASWDGRLCQVVSFASSSAGGGAGWMTRVTVAGAAGVAWTPQVQALPSVLQPWLRAPVPGPAPVEDLGAGVTLVSVAGMPAMLFVSGAPHLLQALGGDEDDIVVGTVTRGLQALWCVSASGLTSRVMRVTSTVLAGYSTLQVSCLPDTTTMTTTVPAFLLAANASGATLCSQLVGQPVRVSGCAPLDARHLVYGLTAGHATGPVGARVLLAAATTPGCRVLLSDPELSSDDAWSVSRPPDSGGRFVLRSLSLQPLQEQGGGGGARTIFLQTLLPIPSVSSVDGSMCVGTSIPREALTVLGRGAFQDGIVLYGGQQGRDKARLCVGDGGGLVVEGRACVHGQVVARSFKTVSDARLKHCIAPVNARLALADLRRVMVRSYRFRDDGDGRDDTGAKMGVLAQELERIVPSAVSETHEGTKVVDTHELLFRAIAAIQALAAVTRGRSRVRVKPVGTRRPALGPA